MKSFFIMFVALTMLASVTSTANAASTVTAGHTAAWYDPARNGEGWILEVLEDDRAAVYFYTYDEEGGQRWLTGSGEVKSDEEGRFIDFPVLYVAQGGKFGPGFDPADVVLHEAGSASLRFEDCRTGRVTYDLLGDVRETPLHRITRTMGARGCTPRNGIPGEPVMAYAGQSGSWYDPSHNGEGFTLHWLADGSAMAYWFSYDTEGNQAWFVGIGQEVDGDIVFSDLRSTKGAKFGAAFNPAEVEHVDWGEMSMALDCDVGVMSYQSYREGFGSGGLNLSRLSRLKNPACPYVKPKLTDLYDFTWTEIPIEAGTVQEPVGIRAKAIADDGTIVATIGLHVGVRRPGGDWELLGESGEIRTFPLLVSPDAKRVVTSEANSLGDYQHPLIWEEGVGWQKVMDIFYDRSSISGASDNRKVLLGGGRNNGESVGGGWAWTEENGAWPLDAPEDHHFPEPVAASNDARIIVGRAARFSEGSPVPIYPGVRWVGTGSPEILKDDGGNELGTVRGCNVDCSVVIGSNQVELIPDHPAMGQAWIWQKDKGVHYLGKAADLAPGAEEVLYYPYVPTDLSADGSMIIGNYAALKPGTTNQLNDRSFIWTQATGLVTIREVIEELGIGDDDWGDTRADSMTSSGDMILIWGDHPVAPYGSDGRHDRAVILGLQPRQ